MLRQGRDFIQEPADGEDVRLASQNNHWAGSFMDQRWEEVRKQKKPFKSCNCLLGKPQTGWGVFISFFLPSTGGQGYFSFISSTEAAGFPEARLYVGL